MPRKKLDPWRALISRVASFPNVYCKISGKLLKLDIIQMLLLILLGIITEASLDWTIEDIIPYIDHVVSSFGTDRYLT